MTDVSRSASPWWRSMRGRGQYVLAVVVGPRRSGKTTWFQRLAEEDPRGVVLWEVRRLARAGSAEDVWADLWAQLGLTATPGADPLELLEDHLDALGTGPVLVVDDWDASVDARGARGAGEVSDACYEVLDSLARFCMTQATTRPGRPCLGLLLLTSLPDVTDLEYFTRAVQRPTFERLSKLVTRSFASERFPMLDPQDSEAVLVDAGLTAEDAAAASRDCGGWLWLLEEAAAAAHRHGGWTQEAQVEVREHRLPGLLDASLLRVLADRPEVRLQGRQPLDYLAQELARGRAPAAFALPCDRRDPARPAPLVDQLLNRAFLIVDTENLRMPFQRLSQVEPQRYPEGVDAFLQTHLGAWLGRLQARHGVQAEDTWLVGRSAERIDATVGAGLPGRRLSLPDGLRRKARKSDHTDDLILVGAMTQHAERYPLARFVLVSADADAPLVLEQLGLLDGVSVCTPWKAPERLRRRIPDPERLIENDLPVARPREVSDAELAQARRGGGRGISRKESLR